MTVTRKQIEADWGTLKRACDRCGSASAADWLCKALEAAIKGEKGHRALGRRWVGDIGRMLPVLPAAKGVVLSHVFDPPPPPSGWADTATYRDDCRLAYAIRDVLDRAGLYPWTAENPPEALAFDYAADVAGHERAA